MVILRKSLALLFFINLFGFASPLHAGNGFTKSIKPKTYSLDPSREVNSPLKPLPNYADWGALQPYLWHKIFTYLSLSPKDCLSLSLTCRHFNSIIWGVKSKSWVIHAGRFNNVPDDANFVTHLTLRGEKLNRHFPKFVHAFKYVNSLSLSGISGLWDYRSEGKKMHIQAHADWFLNFLDRYPNLSRLDLSECKIPPTSLVCFFPEFTKLESLNLYGNKIDNETALLLSALDFSHLRRLNIWLTKRKLLGKKHNHAQGRTGSKNADGFKALFQKFSSLKHLGLKVSWSPDSDIYEDFVGTVSQLSGLVSLEVENDSAGIGKLEVLDLISVCRNLKSLRLTHIHKRRVGQSKGEIDDLVVGKIAENLNELQVLSLPAYESPLSPAGVASLNSLTQLHSLCLSGQSLTTEEVIELSNRLTSLRALDLRNNFYFQMAGAEVLKYPTIHEPALFAIAKNLPHLRALGFSMISNEGMDCISSHMTELEKLCSKDMLDPEKRKLKTKRLSKSMNKLPHLCLLSLSSSQISPNDLAMLKKEHPKIKMVKKVKSLESKDELGFWVNM